MTTMIETMPETMATIIITFIIGHLQTRTEEIIKVFKVL